VTVLYLLRHGRTRLNAAGLLRGRLDEPLDAVGQREAVALAEAFAAVAADVVVSSPLQRARDTAAAVAHRLGLSVVVERGLIDRDYGPWAGTSRDDLERRFGSIDRAPRVEPRAGFDARVHTTVHQLVAGHDVVIAVSHDAVIRSALAQLTADRGGARDNLPQPTGGWNRLEHDAGSWDDRVIAARPGDGQIPN
jgi:broad specificity phosphatase PhoE